MFRRWYLNGQRAMLSTATVLIMLVGGGRATQLYWTDQMAGQISRANLDGSRVQSVAPAFSPRGLAIDSVGRNMYWAIDEPRVPIGPTGAIQRATLPGEDTLRVINDLWNPWQVEYDPVSGWIYWTDLYDGAIRRVRSDGSQPEIVLTDLGMPMGLAVDPRGGRIYWSEQRVNPDQKNLLGSARLDGTDPHTYDLGNNLPYDLAVDPLRGKIYWGFVNPEIDGLFAGFLGRANLDFSNEEPFKSGLGGPRALAIDAAAGMLYWTDWNDVTSSKGIIQRGDLFGGDVEDLVKDLHMPLGLALDLLRLPGDANDDNVVDLADFHILKKNFGTGSLVTQGDFDESLSVDLADFQILKTHFGQTLAAAAPEPQSWWPFTVGALMISGSIAAKKRRHLWHGN